MKVQMKKIILASICIYGMPLLAMQANAHKQLQERLGAFGTILLSMETKLRYDSDNHAEILEASEAFPAAIDSLEAIKGSFSMPIDVNLQRRVQSLRYRILNVVRNGLAMLSGRAEQLNNQIHRYHVASQEEQTEMLEQLNFLTQLYNDIIPVQEAFRFSNVGQLRLINIHALLSQMRLTVGL